MDNNQNAFSSIIGFLFTAIGFAVGVGSIWRFPYVLGENGGSIFLLAYVGIILLIGIPLLSAEITIGYKTQKSAIMAYKELAPNKPWYLGGYLHLIAAILIISYTVPIYAWILKYLIYTASGHFTNMNATEITTFFTNFTSDKWQVFGIVLINILLNALIIRGGVKKGIERITKILLPILGIIMVILIFAGLMLPGASKGIAFLLKPDPTKFTISSLHTALGQAFFAVGIAMLASMVFGSYIKSPNQKIVKNSIIICTALVIAGLLAGFMIFPVLFASGLEPTAGPGLTFITLPNVFNKIAGGTILGTLFYLGFYIAALTSSAGVMESIVGLLMDQFKLERTKALLIVLALMVVIGGACTFSDSLFNFIDLIENQYILTIGAFIIALFVGWIWGVDNFLDAANVQSNFARKWLRITIKYISPVLISIIFLAAYL